MKRLICTMAVLLALCVPARADDGLSMDEALTRPMNVGAMYITDDGKTRLHIRIAAEGRMNVPWSDTGFMIERDGAMYSEAVDPAEFDRVYIETDIPVEPESTDEIISASEGNVTE